MQHTTRTDLIWVYDRNTSSLEYFIRTTVEVITVITIIILFAEATLSHNAT